MLFNTVLFHCSSTRSTYEIIRHVQPMLSSLLTVKYERSSGYVRTPRPCNSVSSSSAVGVNFGDQYIPAGGLPTVNFSSLLNVKTAHNGVFPL